MKACLVEIKAESHCLKQHLISCRFSTCLLLWQGMEVVHGWNSLICAWHQIWPKWWNAGINALQCTKRNILSRNLMPESKMHNSGVSGFEYINGWKLRQHKTWQYCMKTSLTDTFIAKISLETLYRHSGDAKWPGEPAHKRHRNRITEPARPLCRTPTLHAILPMPISNYAGAKLSHILNLAVG